MNRQAYSNFIDSIRAEETKYKYEYCVKDFIKFTKTDDLLKLKVEQAVQGYIKYMRDRKLSSKTIDVRLSAIYHFYTMNDVLLNKVKLSKFKPEFRRVKKDRAYTHEEIHKMLDNAELRMKVAILLMASGGMRIGALPFIKLRHLEKIGSFIKMTVYENTNDEYYTFVTPECSLLIDEYIKQRGLIGEKVTPEAYLIRNDFDVYNPKKSKGVAKTTIRHVIQKILAKSGIKINVLQTHGFRKFFTTQLVNARINPEIRELLLGHKIGLTGVYYKPSEKEMLEEYMKAVNSLTINEEHRLRNENTELQKKHDRLDHVLSRIDIMEKKLGIH